MRQHQLSLCLFFGILFSILPFILTHPSHGVNHHSHSRALGHSALLRRDETYTCNETVPCFNGACCGKSGYCGYGETYCGTSGISPNDNCWSNCDAHAECGKDSLSGNATCPLNVCCSQFGFCGTTDDFCGTGCQNGCNRPGSGATNSSSQKRIIGYYESWANGKQCIGMNIQQIPVESLTHVNCGLSLECNFSASSIKAWLTTA